MLGTGFLGLAVVLASEDTFFRIFGTGPRPRPRDTVNLGLVTLKPGADPDKVAQALREVLPDDTQVFTRAELAANEVAFWTTKTGTGLIFGSGLVVAFIVGIMILYQTLATQITRQLPQFAMLKAIGHTNRLLEAIVLIEAMLMMLAAFLPAVGLSLWVYSVIRAQTLLPVTMAPMQLAGVFAVGVFMSVDFGNAVAHQVAARRPGRDLLRGRLRHGNRHRLASPGNALGPARLAQSRREQAAPCALDRRDRLRGAADAGAARF